MNDQIRVNQLEGGEGTLPHAVEQVNAGLGNSIIIDPSLFGKTVTLKTPLSAVRNADGDLYGIKSDNGLTAITIQLTYNAAVSVQNNGKGNAYGFYSDVANSAMTFGTLGNKLNVKANKGIASGIWSCFEESATGVRTVTAGDFTGDWTIAAGADACGFYLISGCKTNLTLQKFSGTLTVESAGSEAYGIYSYGSGGDDDSFITMGNLEGEIKAVSTGGKAYCISANTVKTGDFTGRMTAAGMDEATGIQAYDAAMGCFAGRMTVTSSSDSVCQACGIDTYNATMGDFTGTMTATGYIAKGIDTMTLTMGKFTGTMTVNGKDKATGIKAYDATMGNFTGVMTVTSDVSATGIAFLIDSTVAIGDFAGTMTVTAMNYDATGIYSYYTTLNMGDFTGTMTVSATMDGYAYGIWVYTYAGNDAIKVGNFAGTMTVTATGFSNGIYSSSSLELGDFTGCITAVSSDDMAIAIDAEKLFTKGQDGKFVMKGVILADGKKTGSCAISTSEAFTGITNGIVGCGYFHTTETETGMADLVAGLKAKDEKTIANTARQSVGYTAIDTKDGDDSITISNGAMVFGNINLYGGADRITISTGARIYGNLTADKLEVNFNVDALTTNVILTVTKDGVFGTDNGTYSITLGKTPSAGEYTLVSGLSANALKGKTFSVTDASGAKLADLSIDGEWTAAGNAGLKLTRKDSELRLSVRDTDASAAPAVTPGQKEKSNLNGVPVTEVPAEPSSTGIPFSFIFDPLLTGLISAVSVWLCLSRYLSRRRSVHQPHPASCV